MVESGGCGPEKDDPPGESEYYFIKNLYTSYFYICLNYVL